MLLARLRGRLTDKTLCVVPLETQQVGARAWAKFKEKTSRRQARFWYPARTRMSTFYFMPFRSLTHQSYDSKRLQRRLRYNCWSTDSFFLLRQPLFQRSKIRLSTPQLPYSPIQIYMDRNTPDFTSHRPC